MNLGESGFMMQVGGTMHTTRDGAPGTSFMCTAQELA